MSHSSYSILAFFQHFLPIKIGLSVNTVWPQDKRTIFGKVNETFLWFSNKVKAIWKYLKLNNFSIFYLGENGGFIAKNWLLLLSAAFSIEQTLYGMSFGFSALYNLGKQQYLAKLQSKSEEETKKLESELLKPEEVAWLKINYSVYSDIVCFILLWFLTRWFLLLKNQWCSFLGKR